MDLGDLRLTHFGGTAQDQLDGVNSSRVAATDGAPLRYPITGNGPHEARPAPPARPA